MTENKLVKVLLGVASFTLLTGFTAEDFSVADFKHYEREFVSESIGACSTSSTKTYEDYRLITSQGSKQYQYIHNHMTVDEETGLLYDEEGFIGVAMGYQFGEIGSRYYVVLDTGNIIPVVKADAKAAVHAENGCSANADASVIEFVIDTDKAVKYFGSGPTGLASQGNFNNYDAFRGNIKDIERVTSIKIEEGIVYEDMNQLIQNKSDETSDQVKMVKGGY